MKYEIIINTTLSKDYNPRAQINGSFGSVIDTIDEGFGSDGNKEFIMFLSESRGSCCKSKVQLLRAYNRNHISKELFQELDLDASNLIDQLSNFRNYLKITDKKSAKFD